MTVELRFLLDEHTSPTHVARFAARGFFAVSVVHAGKAGTDDADLVQYAQEHSLIIITKNARDFLHLALRTDLHPGMILLRAGALLVDVEWGWIEPVLSHLQTAVIDPINLIFEVTGPAVFKVRSIPPAG